MARKITILTALFTVCLSAILFGTVSAQDTYNVQDFNDALANIPRFGGNVVLTENIGPGEIVTDVLGMTGTPEANFRITINKDGLGLWRLGDGTTPSKSFLDSGYGATVFNVHAGTLELMKDSTISIKSGSGSSGFTLASLAALNIRGNNEYTAESPVMIQENAILGFDLSHAAVMEPLLKVNANVVVSTSGPVIFNILGLQAGTNRDLMLMQFNYIASTEAPGIDSWRSNVNNNFLYVRGEAWDDIDRVAGTLSLPGREYVLANPGVAYISLNGYSAQIGISTWNNAASGRWDATSANWLVTDIDGASMGYATFLHNDTAVFHQDNEAIITVQAGGVQIGPNNVSEYGRYGMIVDGGKYVFSNDPNPIPGLPEVQIGIDGAGKVLITQAVGSTTHVTFASANSYWGGTEIKKGAILTAKNAGALGTGSVVLDDGQLIFNIDANVSSTTVWNTITGRAGTTIFKDGDGDVRLVNVLAASDTVVRTGRLVDGVGAGLLTVRAGAFYDPNGTHTVAGLSGDGTVELIYSSCLIVDVANRDKHTFNGELTGNGTFTKTGWGTQVLAELSPNFFGRIEINEGVLAVSGAIGNGAAIRFKERGGTLSFTKSIPDFDLNITIDSGSKATFNTPLHCDVAITGSIGDGYTSYGGVSALAKTGAGRLTIKGNASWTGSTEILEGILDNNIPEDTALTVAQNAEYHTGYANRQVSALRGGGVVLLENDRQFTVNSVIDSTFDGKITGAGDLVKSGQGRFVLTGTNDYSGATRVIGGILEGNITNGTALFVADGAGYASGGANRRISLLEGGGTVNMQTATLTIDQATDTDFFGSIVNGGSLIKSGGGFLRMAGSQYYFDDNVEVRNGTLGFGGYSHADTYVRVGKDLSVAESGTLEVNKNVQISVGNDFHISGTVDFVVGQNVINTGGLILNDDTSILNVSGITADMQEIVIIHSTDRDITGDFGEITVAGESAVGVDYLKLGVAKTDRDVIAGQILRWYSGSDAHGTFTLSVHSGSFTVGTALRDVDSYDSRRWDGRTLTKKGPGTLILAAENSYTGATDIQEGVLRLNHEQATAGSSRINIAENAELQLGYNSLLAPNEWSKGLETPIHGEGSVTKVDANTVTVLAGSHQYTGPTTVREGVLLLDGVVRSPVTVKSGAGFGGNGAVNKAVTFEDHSVFYWRYGKTEKESDMLTVNGNVTIGKNVTFVPVTYLIEGELPDSMKGWDILRYSGKLDGAFAESEVPSNVSGVRTANVQNPFYDFTLDYSQKHVVQISGLMRETPRALSDITAYSLVLPQTKMYRTAYREIEREWLSLQSVSEPQHQTMRGQTSNWGRTAWMNFVGRGDQFDSSFDEYKQHPYSMQSYGFQTGFSIVSNCNTSFGMLFGREEGQLSNKFDKLEDKDYYLGFYLGQKIQYDYEIKSYVGGGWQKHRQVRTGNNIRYGADFNGNTFNVSAELARRFERANDWTVRRFVGIDIEVIRVGSSSERVLDGAFSNENRNYRRSDMNFCTTRAGFDISKRMRRMDFYVGSQVGWNWGDDKPSVVVNYPATNGSVVSHGLHYGRFNAGANLGLNVYLNARRTAAFYIDYNGDVFIGRDGDGTLGTGTLGFLWRF